MNYPVIGSTQTKINFILKTVDTLDISTKLELLQKFATTVAAQVKKLEKLEKLEKRLSEVNENPPSPLSTHASDSTRSSLLDEPKMEEMDRLFPFEDPMLPIIPSAPLMF